MGILQARIMEWATMPSSRRPSQPRDQTKVLLHYMLATKSSQRVQDAENEILAGDASAMSAPNQ